MLDKINILNMINKIRHSLFQISYFIQIPYFCFLISSCISALVRATPEHFLGLRQVLVTGSPLKIIKHAFCFLFKTLFVLKIFNFLSLLFCHVEKWLDQKYKINVKTYDVATWERNNFNALISQYLKKYRESDNEICSVNKI